MDHRPADKAAPRPPWPVARGALLFTISVLAILGALHFRTSDWQNFTGLDGRQAALCHAVLAVIAIGAAISRRPLGLLIGGLAGAWALLLIGDAIGEAIAGLAMDEPEDSSSLGVTNIPLIVLCWVASMVDIVRIGRGEVR